MKNLSEKFKNKEIIDEKLLEYGFIKKENYYIYESNIYNNRFKVVVELAKDKQQSKIIDLKMNDEYILADVKNSAGRFVGRIKEEYESIIDDIIEKCCRRNVFKNNQTKAIIKYVQEKYQDDLEYLWEKFPTNAIWRNKTNNKWYGILLVISKNKLKINSDELVEIIDLRFPKENIQEIIDNKHIFAGYHMNKNNWITIILDGSMNIKEIYKLIDKSFILSLEK